MIKIRNKITFVLAVSLTALIVVRVSTFKALKVKETVSLVEEVFTEISPDFIQEEAVQKLDTAPVWASGLRLLGVIFSDSAGGATAVIEDTLKESQDYYRIGDIIREARVVGISLNRVELLKDGRREVLFMADSKEEISPADDEDLIEIVSDTERIVKRKVFSRRIKGIGEVIKEVKITPVIEAGSIRGFKVNNIKEDGLLSSAGIKEGDIIKRVNGKEINSISSAFNIYKQVRNQPLVKIDIERENRLSTLTYRMD